MGRTPIWTSIATTLTGELAAGRYRPGDKLPTEAALSDRFGVNRHTVRRALAHLAEAGLVVSRRGAGVFVAARPTDYPIGRRVRFTQSIQQAGREPGRRALSRETRAADETEAQFLQIAPGDKVYVSEGISIVDDLPIALARSVFPATRLPGFLNALEEEGSITKALTRCGIQDYTRAWTRLTAQLANPAQAQHLRLKEGAPILRTVSLNIDEQGVPVEYGHCWFSGDQVTLTLAPD